MRLVRRVVIAAVYGIHASLSVRSTTLSDSAASVLREGLDNVF